MAIQKTDVHEHHLTVTLTDGEYALLQEFADEQDIEDLRLALPAMVYTQSNE